MQKTLTSAKSSKVSDDVHFFEGRELKLAYKYYNKALELQTIVLLYGFDGSIKMMDVFAPSFKEYSILVVDYPGHGYSPKRDESSSYDMQQFSRELYNLLQNLNENSIYLLAYSFGGHNAIQFYQDYHSSGIIKKIIFYNSLPKFEYNLYRKLFYLSFQIMISLNFNYFVPHIAIPILTDFFFTRELLKTSQEVALINDTKSVINQFKTIIKKDFSKEVRKIECPVMIIASKKDILAPHKNVKKFAQSIPKAKFDLLKDAGHITLVSKPDTIADYLTDCFNKL